MELVEFLRNLYDKPVEVVDLRKWKNYSEETTSKFDVYTWGDRKTFEVPEDPYSCTLLIIDHRKYEPRYRSRVHIRLCKYQGRPKFFKDWTVSFRDNISFVHGHNLNVLPDGKYYLIEVRDNGLFDMAETVSQYTSFLFAIKVKSGKVTQMMSWKYRNVGYWIRKFIREYALPYLYSEKGPIYKKLLDKYKDGFKF